MKVGVEGGCMGRAVSYPVTTDLSVASLIGALKVHIDNGLTPCRLEVASGMEDLAALVKEYLRDLRDQADFLATIPVVVTEALDPQSWLLVSEEAQ